MRTFKEVHIPLLLLKQYFRVLDLLSNKQLKEARVEINALPSDSFLYCLLMSLYYEFSQQYSQSTDFAKKAWDYEPKSVLETLMALSRILSSYFHVGKYDDALNILGTMPELDPKEETIYWIHSIRNTEAMLLLEKGVIDEGIQKAEVAVTLAEKMNNKRKLGHSLNTLSIGLEWAGKIDAAKKTYLRTLQIKKEVGDEIGYANTLCNLGALMSNLEDPRESEGMYLEALKIYQKHERTNQVAKVHELLGFIKNKIGDQNAALSNYRQALLFAQQLDNEHLKANALKNVISCLIGMNRMEEAETLFPLLQQVVENEGFTDLLPSLTLLEALIYKKKPRAANKIRAQELFRSLLQHPKNYEITLTALTNLIDLYIIEWESYSTEEDKEIVANELQTSLGLLEEQISEYDSKGLLAEFLFLKGKIYCMWGNLGEGRQFLHQAHHLAVAENWKRLENKIQTTLQAIDQNADRISLNEISTSVPELTNHYPSTLSSLKETQVNRFYEALDKRFHERR